MRRGPFAVALVGFAVAGCGDADELTAIREVMRRHVTGIAQGQGAVACRDLTAEARRLVVRSVNERVPELDVRTCEEALGRVAADLAPQLRRQILNASFDVELSDGGTTATADSSATAGLTHLRKLDGRWRITRIEFGPPPSGEG